MRLSEKSRADLRYGPSLQARFPEFRTASLNLDDPRHCRGNAFSIPCKRNSDNLPTSVLVEEQLLFAHSLRSPATTKPTFAVKFSSLEHQKSATQTQYTCLSVTIKGLAIKSSPRFKTNGSQNHPGANASLAHIRRSSSVVSRARACSNLRLAISIPE